MFLNGIFPNRTPLDLSETQWQVVNAFPNLSFSQTLVITPIPSNNRLCVGSRAGYIVSFENDPNTTSVEPFLDLRDRVAVVWDGGFLGLVFHPEFGQQGSPNRGYLYVYYSSHCPLNAERTGIVPPNECSNYPSDSSNGFFSTYLRLSRFEVPDDSAIADPDSEVILLNIRLYNGSHRGGGMLFGDDGYLYLTIGDQFRYETAQDIANTLEGGTMRFAVDITDNGDGSWTCPSGSHLPVKVFNTFDEISGRYYCIPNDNPWLDATGGNFEEYFSIGHRNPHRLTKDPVTGRLWSGEIGEVSREEINVIEKGNNYGWPFREGKIAGVRPEPPSYLGTLTDPVIDFIRDEARAIIAGYVYRGTKFPGLAGQFLAGDYVTNKLWAIALDETTMTATKQLLTNFDPGSLGTWGQDNSGEIFLANVAGQEPIYTLEISSAAIPDPPALLSEVGAIEDLATLQVSNFFVPYNLRQPFWSDAALKWRWIAVPNDGSHNSAGEQIVFSAMSDWQYPVGTVLMKHFELPLDERDSSVTTRLETRFIVKGDDGRWYGVTYRWKPDQSDAVLIHAEETHTYTIFTSDGGTREQTWLFPSRANCMICHNSEAGGAVGPRTHQLNGDFKYTATGITDNQLRTWNHLSMFDVSLDEASIPNFLSSRALNDASGSLEQRSRSYMDSNCSYCHRPDTGNRAFFDARLTTPLENQKLIYGGVADDFGILDSSVITPGDLASSIAYLRMDLVGQKAMPPLAKSMIDDSGVNIMKEWILRIDSGYPRSGLTYEYYEITPLLSLPDFDAYQPIASGSISTFDISIYLREDDFAFRFSGVIYIGENGDYTFYTNSDDGSQLFIDGGLVVDNDGLHPEMEKSGTVPLSQGYHPIIATMFEHDGGEVLDVSWQGPSFGKQPIPAGVLYRETPTSSGNTPPSLDNPGDLSNREGDTVNVGLSAADDDGDDLYYSANNLPPGLEINNPDGVISGDLPNGSNGSYSVTIGVSDGPDADSVTLTWNVVTADGCEGDFFKDGDVDGEDLSGYILDKKGVTIVRFADEFGRTNCD
jgi:uncharacterized repeat protein (TIGR03806 family)